MPKVPTPESPDASPDSLLPTPEAVPDYIADLCSGMIKLAEGARFGMLAYLLGMARLEAESLSQRLASNGRPGEQRGAAS